jgi:hypothetical protein
MSELPKRPLGRTGHEVTIVSLGGVKYNQRSEAHAVEVVNRALDLGINYIDTAHSYSDSERKIGLVLKDRRDEVFLATKSTQRGRDGMRREIEQSFERLQTDRLDLVQVHDLHTEEQLAQVTGPDGALRAIEEYRDAGSVRFIGVTGHRYPELLAKALREYPFDTILVSLGAMQAAVRPFYDTVMPAARERGVGVVGMKVMAHGWFGEAGLAADALRFVMGSDGVATALVGVDDVEQLEQNVRVARENRPLIDAERQSLLEEVRRMYEDEPDRAWFIFR